MIHTNNYRFFVQSSLQIFKDQRERLFNDFFHKDPTIYNGLYTEQPEISKLYFQSYFVKWVDSHWNYMQNIYCVHDEYTRDERKYMTLFFAEYFVQLVNNVKVSGNFSKLSVHEMLVARRKILDYMIMINENWEKGSNELKVLMKKNDASFRKMINECENRKEY